MKNQWLVWAFIAGVIVIVIIAFNSENQRKGGHYTEEVSTEVQYEDESAFSQDLASGVSLVKEDAKKAVVQSAKEDVSKTAQETYQTAKAKVSAIASDITVKTNTDADQVVSQVQAVMPSGDAEISSFSDVAYTIQISSVKELKDAQKILADVLKKNYAGYIAQRNLGSKGIWYRVYVGKFAAKTEADIELQNVKKNFTSAFVIAPVRKKIVNE